MLDDVSVCVCVCVYVCEIRWCQLISVPSFSSMPSIMYGSIGIVAQFVIEHIRRVCRYG